ncbi:DgyrCDS9296 [Dimorphilus gyrociliatus]|uniref:DgyrCDS9296 n=1 Tax=Dimorphilus gyrociliatus TaxID=2664684 RepID=A0A7I8VWK6_9ANNE|nr:DgyrCDS9296 [Dimorphilus gyrociliatus]
MSLIQIINQILSSGQYKSVLAPLKGLRNGAVYGAKIRAPHALVMTFLFKGGPLMNQLKGILEATFTHSKNLASFVFIYKSISSVLEKLQGDRYQFHSFVAAFIGGYIVFGRYNKINEQINLYLLSRILYALAKLAVEKGAIPKPKGEPFPIFGALVWGIVLWLFEHHRSTLQPSLKSSMTYLYDDSNVWHSIKDFLLFNKSAN